MRIGNFVINTLFAVMICGIAFAQSGGNFTIKDSTVEGSGHVSSGGDFSLDAINGQAVAGRVLRGNPYSVTSGFWNFTPAGPTAAQVAIGGRVTTADGFGIANARLTLIPSNGSPRSAISSAFGYYQFTDVTVGEIYIVSISARRFTFAQPTVVRAVFDEVTDLDFVADPH
jgi:hypothetical protein